ncbi:MAG: selenocysteine-specific translation elongation factor [Proteobacteria bacterium]|nr:selenocysteine-specific translation elongation factor [Pseudomonadota bacterium]
MQKIKRISSIIGTAGHVDHGKSTLIRALTGIETDTLAEEKRRGVSIELGFAYIDFDVDEKGKGGEEGANGTQVRAAIIDVPGHERFIRTMLAGATGIDVALLVVATDDGVMPQTIEHVDILHCLGVESGVVVLSKCDLVTPERVSEVEAEVGALLKGTALEGAEVVRYSSVDGTGLEEIKQSLASLVLSSVGGDSGSSSRRSSKRIPGRIPRRIPNEELFRLPIDRSFSIKGFGTVVTGTIASGAISKESVVETFPQGRNVKVRTIESLNTEVARAERGERAAINLSGIGYKELKRGEVLVSPALAPFAAMAMKKERFRADVTVELLADVPGIRSVTAVKKNATLMLHHLTGSTLVRIRFKGSDGSNARETLAPGESTRARLLLANPLVLLRGDAFVLRDPATASTVGGGRVGAPYFERELMPAIDSVVGAPCKRNSVGSPGDIIAVLNALLPENGLGFELGAVAIICNVTEPALKAALADRTNGLFVSNGFVLSCDCVERVRALVKEALLRFYDEGTSSALADGLNEELLLKSLLPVFSRGLGPQKARTVVKYIIEEMIEGVDNDSSDIERSSSGGLVLSSRVRAPKSGSGDSEVEGAIIEIFNTDGLKSVTATELSSLGFALARIDAAVAGLKRAGAIVEFKRDGFLLSENVERAEAELREFLSLNPSIEAKEFRDLLGCGRKLAIELLEYFDSNKVTIRRGDERILM